MKTRLCIGNRAFLITVFQSTLYKLAKSAQASALLLIGLLSASAVADNDELPRATDQSAIIRGQEALVSQYPFMGYMADSSGGQYCGASLIASRWVLTAAHCFLNENEDGLDLETGITSLAVFNTDTVDPAGSGAIEGKIERIIPHPNYNPNFETSDNANDADIALVELTAPVDLKAITLAGAGATPAADTTTIIMGWGASEVSAEGEPGGFPNNLMQSTQKIVSLESCNNIYGGDITSNMLCAAGPESDPQTDTCQGDSGGPMVVANNDSFVQVGIVSFGGTDDGPSCGDPNAPGVYADVAAFNAFIKEHTTGVMFSDDSSSGGGESTGALGAATVSLTIEGTLLTIDWTEVSGATGYTLYYAPYPDPTTIFNLDMGSATTISGELSSGDAFYVAVEAYNENGASPELSNIENFTIP